MTDSAGPGVRPVVAVLDVFPESSTEALRESFAPDFDLVFIEEDTPAARRAAAAEATALMVMWGGIDADLLAAAPHCRVIQKLGVGVDKIDLDEAERRGVTVLKAAGINAAAVAELVILLTLAVSRNLPFATREYAAGNFAKEAVRATARQLPGRTVGLVGLGNVGREVAKRFRPFGVSLVYFDPFRAPVETERELGLTYAALDDVLSTSDVISIHVPLTDQTRNLIDATSLQRVRSDAIVINTSRGGVVDDLALGEAIAAGRLLGAGLDVTSSEPLPADSPLFGVDRLVLTPHIGGAVADNFVHVAARAASNIRAVLAGEPVSPADLVVGPSPSP